MKNTSKLACLFSLGLLSSLCMLASINITNGEFNIDLNFGSNLTETTHKSRLKTLFLGGGENGIDSPAWMTTSSTSLDVFKGLIVGKTIGEAGPYSSVVIGGGQGNQIQSDKAGIAGGTSNHITTTAELAAIGGGAFNSVSQRNGVVAGGSGNFVKNLGAYSNEGGVVLGGADNKSDAGVVLGGKGNEIGKNGLAMGVSAKGGDRSFVRNDGTFNGTASEGSAVIGAKNGVLIGTYTPVTGASLVVSGAVKIGGTSENPVAGEIRLETDNCLYAYDGTKWHILGKNSQTSCTAHSSDVAVTCEFGRILLQEGNVVDEAYSQAYASSCSAVKVTCKNVGGVGKLVPESGTAAAKYYPSCFKTDGAPYHW